MAVTQLAYCLMRDRENYIAADEPAAVYLVGRNAPVGDAPPDRPFMLADDFRQLLRGHEKRDIAIVHHAPLLSGDAVFSSGSIRAVRVIR